MTNSVTALKIDFVIDTNLYAGNFERELCAYLTGVWDGTTHGGDQAAVFDQEVPNNPFGELVEFRPDGEHGWMQPQHLELTPPGLKHNNSVAIHFRERPTPDLIELLKSRAFKFASEGLIFDEPVKGLKITGFRLLVRSSTVETKTEQL